MIQVLDHFEWQQKVQAAQLPFEQPSILVFLSWLTLQLQSSTFQELFSAFLLVIAPILSFSPVLLGSTVS